MEAYLPIILQALGGLVGANVIGGLTRGGGGVFGRSLAGVVGGVAAGQGLPSVTEAQPLIEAVSTLLQGENGARLGDVIIGAGGGGVLGLVTGLLVRPRG